MHELLTKLSTDELGCRFLINLSDCLADGSIPARLVRDVLERIHKERADEIVDGERFISILADVLFEDPDSYQFIGPRPARTRAQWLTVKSFGDIVASVSRTSKKNQEDLRAELGVLSLNGPQVRLSNEQGLAVASLLSDQRNGYNFALARAFPHPETGLPRFAPSWFSKWAGFPSRRRWADRPSQHLAGRLRDWLGLSHYGAENPLFIFRARKAFPIEELAAHRPTLFDGFDNKIYKHRCTVQPALPETGSTMDIEKAHKAQLPGADLDGGLEIVSRGIWFSPDRFECEFVGITPPLSIDPARDQLHRLMLSRDSSLESVREAIISVLSGEVDSSHAD